MARFSRTLFSRLIFAIVVFFLPLDAMRLRPLGEYERAGVDARSRYAVPGARVRNAGSRPELRAAGASSVAGRSGSHGRGGRIRAQRLPTVSADNRGPLRDPPVRETPQDEQVTRDCHCRVGVEPVIQRLPVRTSRPLGEV